MDDRLMIGIEQELIVLNSGEPPSLSTIQSVFEELTQKDYRPTRTTADGRPLQVNREMPGGYAAIKNDFSTNIIEFALPPASTPEHLCDLYEQVFVALQDALTRQRLTIHTSGYLKLPREKIIPVPGQRLDWLLHRPIPKGGRFRDRFFAATIAATQIHLNILNDNIYGLFPGLYSLEYLVPLFFSNSPDASSGTHCVRPLIYRDNYPPTYKALGIPGDIPSSKEGYSKLIADTIDFQRDYTLIAPRAMGTVEFRSACTQPTIHSVLDLIALRLLILSTIQSEPLIPGQRPNIREHFYSVCERGTCDEILLRQDFSRLQKATPLLPLPWQETAKRTLARIESELPKRSSPTRIAS